MIQRKAKRSGSSSIATLQPERPLPDPVDYLPHRLHSPKMQRHPTSSPSTALSTEDIERMEAPREVPPQLALGESRRRRARPLHQMMHAQAGDRSACAVVCSGERRVGGSVQDREGR